MAVLALAAAGAAIGYAAVGTTMAGSIGWALGSMIGSSMMSGGKNQNVEGPRATLIDLKVTGVSYGQAIPYLRGCAAIAGQIWWASDRRPTTTATSTTTGGGGGKGGGGGGGTTTTTTYTTVYDMDMLVGLTDNVIDSVARIWANGTLVWSESVDDSVGTWDRLTVYTGAPSQLPDPTYEAAVGTGYAPAYRGRGTVFIQGLKLGTSGQVPNLVFEVVADGTVGYVAVAPFAVFDPAQSGPHLTFTGDLEVANGSGIALECARAEIAAKATGKWFYEMVVTHFGNGNYFGFAADAWVSTGSYPSAGSWVGREASSGISIDTQGGTVWHDNVNIGSFSTFLNISGTVVGIAIDMDLGVLRLYKNGVLNPNIVNFTPNAAIVPAVSLGNANDHVVMNFGQNAWTYGPPSGFYGFGTLRADSVTPNSNLREVVEGLCARAGLSAGQYDASLLSSSTIVYGLPITAIGSTRAALEVLMSVFQFEMTVSDKIYFRPRGGASVATIPYLDLGATQGEEQTDPFPLHQANDLEIAAQFALTYINFNDAYENDTQYSDRLITASPVSLNSNSVQIVMTPSAAKAVVDVMAFDQAASIASATINVLGTYCALEPTDPVTVTDAGGNLIRCRIVRKTDSFPLLSLELVTENVSVLTSSGVTSEDYDPIISVQGDVDTVMELMDIPILRDDDNDAGFYVATRGASTPYPGAIVFRSVDGGVEYTRVVEVGESAVLGECTTTLGDYTGPRLFDRKNSVTVDLGADGVLESTTRNSLLSSAAVNAMLIGDEIVQFLTAELVSAGVYTLKGLLRGCRGTEWARTGHASSERCVLLRTAGLRRIVPNNSQLGIPLKYKGVTANRAMSTASAVDFTDSAIGLKPFSPTDARGARDGSNNLTITWQRRSRMGVRTIGTLGIDIPLGEASESYEVDVYVGSPLAVVRTISGLTSPSASYSAADQITDGHVPGEPVYLKVYQLSASVGRGYALEATV